ncbi:MAG: hypothetical protein ACR2HF_07630 [Methylococcaceae bacterium]
MRGWLLLLLLSPVAAVHAWTWHGQVRTKLQTDNRYTGQSDVLGEVWGQVGFEDSNRDLKGAVDVMGHAGRFDFESGSRLYQAYLDQGYSSLDSRIKLGRFERTDNLGFYLVDGGALTYTPEGKPWRVELYAGRPRRIDHVRSVEGDFIGGVEWRRLWNLNLGGANWPWLQNLDVRGGYQRFAYATPATVSANASNLSAVDGVEAALLLADAGINYAVPVTLNSAAKTPAEGVDRWQLATTATGHWRPKRYSQYEWSVLGTYRSDQARMENALTTAWADLSQQLRLRGSYEYYRPREPFLSFRERFYSAYALGEQTLLKSRVHYSPNPRWTGYVGGMRATREGDDGYGGDLGVTCRITPNLSLSGELDYLGLGADQAKSAYAALSHTASARLQIKLNTALRFEQKQFYGDNRAMGAEAEARYMVHNNWIVHLAASQIWNTRLPDEYLAAVQVIYYFDPFKPKAN